MTTTPSTQPLTLELATAYLCQVDLIPKQKPCEIGLPAIDERGYGVVTVRTVASTPTIVAWFRRAGLCVTRFDRTMGTHTWVAHFRVMPLEVEL